MDIVRNETSAGQMVRFELSTGVHNLTDVLHFDGSVLASEVSIIGDKGAVIRLPLASERRQLSTYNGAIPAAIVLSTQLLIQLQDVTFQSGASSFGIAAVVVESGELVMHNCTVRGVQGTRALHANGGSSTIISSLFEANLAGAIVAASGGKLFIGSSALVNNSAANGGALAVTGDSTEVAVVATRIARNSAKVRGGGVWVAAGNVVLANSTLLEKNMAPDGAALHLSGGSTVCSYSIQTLDLLSIIRSADTAFVPVPDALPAPPAHWVNTAVEKEVHSLQVGLTTLVTPHMLKGQ